jgi:hypothetical protein
MKQTLLLTAALFSTACSGTEPRPLRIAMSIDKQAVALDDSLRVVLTVVNTSPAPVMVYPPSAYGPCGFAGFELFDRDWREALEGYFCLAAAPLIVFLPDPVPLDPGETIEMARWWHPARTLLDGVQIRPGLYRIRGEAVAVDRTVRTPARDIIVGR